MPKSSLRKIQAMCFLFSHIPLAAIVLFSVREGIRSNAPVVLVAFVATLVTAALMLHYIGRALGRDPAASAA